MPSAETLSLLSLFASSFLAATVLPGGSEAVLFGVLKLHPHLVWPALLVATLGNTLGGMTSYALGRFLPKKKPLRGLELMRRYGSPMLLLSWVPLIGDVLCVAAGWLRMHAGLALFWITLGKFARYAVIAYLLA